MATSKKCLICNRVFTDKTRLVGHIGKEHKSQIPQDWTPAQYENFLRTGRTHGTCVVCKGDTTWNESTWKWNRMCEKPECREALASKAKANMKAKYGKEHLLDDPEMQRKMVYSKKTSGTYHFESDDGEESEVMYDSSYGKDFLEMLDHFLGYSACDIAGPSPNTYEYKYNGESHFYIPDFYIYSLNLEVEIKDGGDNPNMMPKIQQVDKVKEAAKDKVMASLKKKVNYIKVVNKQYKEFFQLCMQLKNSDMELQPVNGITKSGSYVSESVDFIGDMGKLVTNTKLLYAPRLNFNQLLRNYEKQIPTLQPQDIAPFEQQITIIRNRLQEIVNEVDDSEENSRMYYEAKKSIDYIDSVIIPMLNKRINQLNSKDHSLQEPEFVVEGNVNPDDKYILLSEATEIEAFDTYNISYHPVFVVLTYTDTKMAQLIQTYTKDPYSHASVAFDTNLNHMFSFNRSGFVDEDIKRGAFVDNGDKVKYSLYMYMAPDAEYSNMLAFLDSIEARKTEMKYNILGLVDFVFGKDGQEYKDRYFCSEFVVSLLKAGNPDLLKHNASSYRPSDISRSRRLTFIKKGLMKKYNPKEIDKLVANVLAKEGFQNVNIK